MKESRSASSKARRMVRLAKFDRKKGISKSMRRGPPWPPRKTDFYRVDAPREGRVRLTVRDGGSARIYSDTSGFTLRDERTAELVARGENAGDWDFYPARARDAVDDWVNEREQYLAQRLA